MERLIIKDGCIACGICYEITDLIVENGRGMAEANPLLEITQDNLRLLKQAVEECPENCIHIEDRRLIEDEGEAGIRELKKLIVRMVESYQGCLPPKDEYRFVKEHYEVRYSTDIRGSRQYIYKSSEKADREALKEFNRVMYSQRKAMIQGVVVEYMAKKIKPFIMNTTSPGDFLYEANMRMNIALKEIVSEANRLTERKINLPEGFDAFDIFIKESSLLELKDAYQYMYSRGNFENKIDRELESLEWYDTTMTNDDKDEYNSKGDWKGSKYCYTANGIAQACKELADDIVLQTYYVMDDYEDGIEYHLRHNLRYCFRDIKDVLLEKAKILINELDRFLPEESRGHYLPCSSDISIDKMGEKSEGVLVNIFNREYDQINSDVKTPEKVLSDITQGFFSHLKKK